MKLFQEQDIQIDDERSENIVELITQAIESALSVIETMEEQIKSAGLNIPDTDEDLISNIKRDLNSLKDEPLSVSESFSSEDRSEKILEIIKKIGKGKYRVYSKKKNRKTGKRRNLGTYSSIKKAKERKKDIEFFKSMGE